MSIGLIAEGIFMPKFNKKFNIVRIKHEKNND